ncbi:MAG: anti-sigma factor family protein, partial [Planctomycetota bacterium]
MHCENSEQILSAYLDGELSEEERRQVESHIKQCDDCRHELESLRRTVEVLHELPTIPASPDFTSRVLAELNMNEVPSRITTLWRRGMAVAAVFLVIITAVFLVDDGIIQKVRSVRYNGAMESTDEFDHAKQPFEANEKAKRRSVAKQADNEVDQSKQSEKTPELEPHQIIALPSEKDYEGYQMVELAKTRGLKKAHIDVNGRGGTVITLKVKGREYEQLFHELVAMWGGSVTITNTPATQKNMYFKRLAQRYSSEADGLAVVRESGGRGGRREDKKGEPKHEEAPVGGEERKNEARARALDAARSSDTESSGDESDDSGFPEEVVLQINIP